MKVCSFDPYDLWATDTGVAIRSSYYQGEIIGKIGAVCLSLLDLSFPRLARGVFKVAPRVYPILSSHVYLTSIVVDPRSIDRKAALADLKGQAVGGPEMLAWGLGFPWMSKNGLYGPEVPFVTHTPYVMEALVKFAADEQYCEEAMEMFQGTWNFLESLKVMYEDEESLALSYAPVDEPRIVVNANSYAAFAYALHAVYGKNEVRNEARIKCLRILRWVKNQQANDGSWSYYADSESGNFIDGFHSCFVVKNLYKVRFLLPEAGLLLDETVQRGWSYIRSHLYDGKAGLCRRFVTRSHYDPFKWDLYDQAEYLGLLVDFELLEEAREFSSRVENMFKKGLHWYSRVDIIGRRWGKDFLRWGIVPMAYQSARLDAAVNKGLICAE